MRVPRAIFLWLGNIFTALILISLWWFSSLTGLRTPQMIETLKTPPLDLWFSPAGDLWAAYTVPGAPMSLQVLKWNRRDGAVKLLPLDFSSKLPVGERANYKGLVANRELPHKEEHQANIVFSLSGDGNTIAWAYRKHFEVVAVDQFSKTPNFQRDVEEEIHSIVITGDSSSPIISLLAGTGSNVRSYSSVRPFGRAASFGYPGSWRLSSRGPIFTASDLLNGRFGKGAIEKDLEGDLEIHTSAVVALDKGTSSVAFDDRLYVVTSDGFVQKFLYKEGGPSSFQLPEVTDGVRVIAAPDKETVFVAGDFPGVHIVSDLRSSQYVPGIAAQKGTRLLAANKHEVAFASEAAISVMKRSVQLNLSADGKFWIPTLISILGIISFYMAWLDGGTQRPTAPSPPPSKTLSAPLHPAAPRPHSSPSRPRRSGR